MTLQYIVKLMYGALDKKHDMNNHITKSFNHTEALWYRNINAKNPDAKVVHNQNVELTVQSRAKSTGGVIANKTNGINAMICIINWCGIFTEPRETAFLTLPYTHYCL